MFVPEQKELHLARSKGIRFRVGRKYYSPLWLERPLGNGLGMPPEVLWIAAGVGWGLATGFIVGFRMGLNHTPHTMRALVRDIDDELDKLVHAQDRARHRVNNKIPTSAADRELPATGAEGVSGADHKSAIRRRAFAQGLIRMPAALLKREVVP